MAHFKDATITKTETHRLTTEITGSPGKQAIEINIDGQSVAAISECNGAWYLGLIHTGPAEGQEKIGATPEEALEWWIRSHGFTESA
jgi:hypothetical protein